MSGFLGSLFSRPTKATQPTAVSGVNVQSSVYGKAIPIVYGTTRIAGNLISYGNFTAVAYTAPSSGGGKGTLFGSSGSAGTTTYFYFAAFAFALCEGPIQNVGTVWEGKNLHTLSSLGFSLFVGSYPQTAWGTSLSYLFTNTGNTTLNGVAPGATGNFTSTSFNYNGIAYISNPHFALGSSSAMPNLNYEVYGIYSNSVTGQIDADPSLVFTDILTNVHYGAGFPSSMIGSLTTWHNYCLAAGLLVSPCYDSQQSASQIIDELATATNSQVVWSSGVLTVVPYGDQPLTGNGATYAPPSTPLFDLTDDDFMVSPSGTGSSSSSSSGPVLMTRKRSSDKINQVKIEFLDRSNNYNPAIAYANEQALIDRYGLRSNGSKQMHLFCTQAAANLSANLQLRRQHVVNTYQFDLDQRYILLDPMDIVTITDSNLGLNRQWVRITEIVENDDGSLSVTAEEYLAGTGAAPTYAFESAAGYLVNYNDPPGVANNPVFIEPPQSLSGGLEIWIAASGPTNWGGADVYVSSDNVNYAFVQRIHGGSRTGTSINTLATYAGDTRVADQINAFEVDLTESRGVLTATTQQQAINLETLSFLSSTAGGGELIAYANAGLISSYNYSLSYLMRGAYGTTVSSHPTGSRFARLDNSVIRVPYTPDRFGQTLYVKFLGFNQYGGGQLGLADVAADSYLVQGTALVAPLADVTDLVQAYIGNISVIEWSEIEDFRSILYEIRKGPSWDSAQFLARQAHPPFRTVGDGLYWVSAFAQPIPGQVVYSLAPQSITVSAASVTANIIATRTEDPTWAGTLAGNVIKAGLTIQSDNLGGGTYTIATGDRIFTSYPFACSVLINWTSLGIPLNNSIFYYNGTGTISNGSNAVSGLQIFSGNGQLYGNTTVTIPTTTSMGGGQPISGVGISSGAVIVAILSTTTLTMSISATTGSTLSPSTQTITVNPYLAVGEVIESTFGIPAGAKIASVTSLSAITMSTTATASSTAATITISLDWLNTPDFFGSGAGGDVDVHPEIRVSTNGGSTWGNWQKYASGYYTGNGFDARMQIETFNLASVAVLENFSFSVDVPDRLDHYNNIAISSLGSTIVFRPDGGTTAPFNGGPAGTTISSPLVVGNVVNGSAGDSLTITGATLSQCVVQCFNSAATAQPRNVNLYVKGY